MKQWFYAEGNSQQGPVPAAVIRTMLEEGRLNADTLVWCDGMPDWLPVSQIAEFELSPYAPPKTDPNETRVWDSYAADGPQVRPWIRFWARGLDLFCIAILLGLAMEWINPAWVEMNDTVFNILISFIAIPIEAAFFSIFGTTPFKALLNIRVRNKDGSKLDFKLALIRSFNVWLRGNGVGIPLASIIANIIAYRNLAQNHITTWDAQLGLVVSHRSVPVWRGVIIVAFVIGFIALIAYSDIAM